MKNPRAAPWSSCACDIETGGVPQPLPYLGCTHAAGGTRLLTRLRLQEWGARKAVFTTPAFPLDGRGPLWQPVKLSTSGPWGRQVVASSSLAFHPPPDTHPGTQMRHQPVCWLPLCQAHLLPLSLTPYCDLWHLPSDPTDACAWLVYG